MQETLAGNAPHPPAASRAHPGAGKAQGAQAGADGSAPPWNRAARVPGWRPGSQFLTEAALPGLLATQPLTAGHVGASQLLGDFTGPGREGAATCVHPG